MQKLIEGVQQFQAKVYNKYESLFEKLSGGQSPQALFITCCDSRIDPNLITGTNPGDLFVHRNIGNIVPAADSGPSAEAATIEYAVEALGVKEIVVCGHSKCGAMQGLLNEAAIEPLPGVRNWLKHAAEAKATDAEGDSDDLILRKTIQRNVILQVEHLKTHASVAKAVDQGKLTLHGWIYQFESGDVFIHDASYDKFATVRPGDDDWV